MSKTQLYSVAIIFLLFIIFLVWQMTAYKVPEPKYQVVIKQGDIEIRQYPPLIVAQVQVEGERYAAINAGFKMLADYIFGNNYTEQKISMTAPVIQQETQISMTAPVSQQKNGNAWRIRFVMPEKFTIKTIPKPKNKKILLLEVPAKKYAVIRFSGKNTEENLIDHEAILKDFIMKNNLKEIDVPIYAFYNPPWILPFLRRNEIMIEVE